MFVRGYRLFSDFAYGQTADSRQAQEDQAEPKDGVGAVAGLRDGFGSRGRGCGGSGGRGRSGGCGGGRGQGCSRNGCGCRNLVSTSRIAHQSFILCRILPQPQYDYEIPMMENIINDRTIIDILLCDYQSGIYSSTDTDKTPKYSGKTGRFWMSAFQRRRKSCIIAPIC